MPKRSVSMPKQGDQNVLVFHLKELGATQLNRGGRTSSAIMQRVSRQIEVCLGPEARVCVQRNGTVIAILHGDRQAAEDAARLVTENLAATSTSPHPNSTPIHLACGIITFPNRGEAFARLIPPVAG